MKSRLCRSVFYAFALMIIAGCASPPTSRDDAPVAELSPDEFSGYIEAQIAKPISLYELYNNLAGLFAQRLKQCSLVGSGFPEEFDQFTAVVIDYGKDLEAYGLDDADKMTIQNEKYWKAILVLTANDITALGTRFALLMRDGLLRRAEIMALFCMYDINAAMTTDQVILYGSLEELKNIEAESNGYMERGVKKWDQGKKQEAMDLYRKAQEVYPKNPWALWEIGLARFMLNPNLDPEELMGEEFESYYSLIRKIDPHYQQAYQGEMTPDLKAAALALLNQVEPNYRKLWQGQDVLASMRELADGYFAMQEYEYALYAYKFLLVRTYEERFDEELVQQITACLYGLEMDQVIPFLNEFLAIVSTALGQG